MDSKSKILVSVVGPTAVGKTKLAIEIAQHFNTEIISADSRQFYRELEIGTAKPDESELIAAKHHLINNLSITEFFTVGDFEREVLALLFKLFKKHKVVVMVGGSGLFCKAIWEGLDEMPRIKEGMREELNDQFEKEGLGGLLKELKEKDPTFYDIVDRNNPQRVIRALEVIRSSGQPFSELRKGEKTSREFINLKIGLNMERADLFERINSRMDQMISKGLFEEAESLTGCKSHNALQTVGYSEIFKYLDGEYDREEAVRLLKRNSRRYAKRQLTWFQKDEEIAWYQPNDLDQIIRLIESQLNT
ncbi:MAG: tRNA (adenosine(37)-N6)-dimethylallyltransferase MiaA [Cyclobacteriaceae bacterium]